MLSVATVAWAGATNDLAYFSEVEGFTVQALGLFIKVKLIAFVAKNQSFVLSPKNVCPLPFLFDM